MARGRGRRPWALGAWLLACVASSGARADPPPARYAWIDLHRYLSESDEGKEASRKLRLRKDELMHPIDLDQLPLQVLRSRYQDEPDDGPLHQWYRERSLKMSQDMLAVQKQLEKEEQAELQRIVDAVGKRVAAYAAGHGVTMVFETNTSLAWSRPGVDLSEWLMGRDWPQAVLADKVAKVDFNRALASCRRGARARAALEREFAAKQAELDAKEAAVKAEEKRVNAMPPESSAAAREALRAHMIEALREYNSLKRDLKDHEKRATDALSAAMQRTVGKIAEQRGLDLVVDTSLTTVENLFGRDPKVPFSLPFVDLTAELIRLFDKQNP